MSQKEADEDRGVAEILGLLDEGKFEQAAHQAKILSQRLRLDLGGLPVAVCEVADSPPSTGDPMDRTSRAQALTRRAHRRWLRGVLRLLRKEAAVEDLELSFTDLNAASCLDDGNPMARVRLANSMLFAARYVRALRLRPCADLGTAKRELKAALRLSPTCAPAHHGLGFLRLSTAQGLRLSGGDPQRAYSRAVDAFAAAVEHDPTNARSHQDLGIAKAALARHRQRMAQSSHGLLTEALEHFERAVALDPALWRASYKAAQILTERGEAGRARHYVAKCRRIEAEDCPRLNRLEARLWRSVDVDGAVSA